MGFTIFLYIVALVHKNLLHAECTRDSHNILLIYMEVRLIAHKHNPAMISDASPGAADPKMNESFVHMAWHLTTVHLHRMGTSNVPIQPLLTEICGRTVVGFWVVLVLWDI